MRYALNCDREKIEVNNSKEEAICPTCGKVVYGRKGKIVSPYWTHSNIFDCDMWSEPITQWHLDWQNQFPKEYQEVTMIDYETGEKHRADIRLPNGTVIEIQNSPIGIDEIESREKFYGKENMIWVLNGANLAKDCNIKYTRYDLTKFYITIWIPCGTYKTVINYDEYYCLPAFYDSQTYQEIVDDPNFIREYEANGVTMSLYFSDPAVLNYVADLVENEIKNLLQAKYGNRVFEELLFDFKVTIHKEYEGETNRLNFEKKRWRKFIDRMDKTILFDNLNGLSKNHLYRYPKKHIVEKNRFVRQVLVDKKWPY
ncbi:MAG: competence protein CoiA family protein [Cytophagales bacterium]